MSNRSDRWQYNTHVTHDDKVKCQNSTFSFLLSLFPRNFRPLSSSTETHRSTRELARQFQRTKLNHRSQLTQNSAQESSTTWPSTHSTTSSPRTASRSNSHRRPAKRFHVPSKVRRALFLLNHTTRKRQEKIKKEERMSTENYIKRKWDWMKWNQFKTFRFPLLVWHEFRSR